MCELIVARVYQEFWPSIGVKLRDIFLIEGLLRMVKKIFGAYGKDYVNWKCIIHLGGIYVDATKEPLHIEFGGIMLVRKEKSCNYQSKDNMIL